MKIVVRKLVFAFVLLSIIQNYSDYIYSENKQGEIRFDDVMILNCYQ